MSYEAFSLERGILRLVIVIYDNGTELGSVSASQYGQRGSSSGASAYVDAPNPALSI